MPNKDNMEFGLQVNNSLPVVRITAKGMRWQRTGHPWLYRDDLAGEAKLPPGELAAVLGPQDRFLGQAFYSANSRIALRFVTYGKNRWTRPFGSSGSGGPWTTGGGWSRTATPSA